MLRTGLLTILALAALACGATTAPSADSLPVQYDLTTTIQRYSYPDPAQVCTSASCPHKTVASPGSSLSGSFVLDANRALNSGDGSYGVSVTSFAELDCGGGTACRSRVVSYGSHGLAIAADTLSERASFLSDGEYVYLMSGRVTGDSVVGTFSWTTFSGMAWQGYTGTYVARPHR